MESLVNHAELFRQECEGADGDVVILREIHRIDRGEGRGLGDREQEEFRREADKFQEVTGRMASCEWTRPEHEWLSRRNYSRLSAEERARFEDAPLLMDGRRMKSDGQDGAEQMNGRELVKLATRADRPILRVKSSHDKPRRETAFRAEALDSDEFNHLSAFLHLCEGARVLLTRNEWVEAGLMNGAIGTVRGFVWPEGGDPNAKKADGKEDLTKQALCVIVEFDDVNLGEEEVRGADGEVRVDAEGKPLMAPRTFFFQGPMCGNVWGWTRRGSRGRTSACRSFGTRRRRTRTRS